MPTADEKPVSVRLTEPLPYRKLGSTCQGRANEASGAPPFASGGFLLLNFASPYRDNFTLSLRLYRYRVIVPEEYGKTYGDLTNDEIRNADYIFCDLTCPINHDEFQELRRICRLRRTDGIPLPKTCWVPRDWAAEFQGFIGDQFEAHIIPCTTRGQNLLLEAIHEVCEGGAL